MARHTAIDASQRQTTKFHGHQPIERDSDDDD
jgi:hypothetical protein